MESLRLPTVDHIIYGSLNNLIPSEERTEFVRDVGEDVLASA
jgi:hypothetical protein